MYQPLADALRPQTLDEVCGQQHILGVDGLLRRIVESDQIPNLIFYGPSGTGKTTVANIIASRTKRTLYKLNATTASLSDIKAIIDELDTFVAMDGALLYLDEIQYFSKRQQQSLLEFIENGKITLIASTTENPYFYIYNAILSRCTVFEFKQLSAEDVRPALSRAVDYLTAHLGVKAELEDGVLSHISAACGGDVRKALGMIEVLFSASRQHDGVVRIAQKDAETVARSTAGRYDRDGDTHYDLVSALQKSVRGSDPDAAVHYLARLLQSGDLLSPCRRILVMAAEDVGLAYPQIIPIVKACVDSAMQLGLPEAQIPLGDAVILMATAPKSNSGCMAIEQAMADVQKGKVGPVPRQLQNVHCDGTGFERDQGYLYPHSFPNHWVKQQYLPDGLVGTQYYAFGENKQEQAAKRYWDEIKKS